MVPLNEKRAALVSERGPLEPPLIARAADGPRSVRCGGVHGPRATSPWVRPACAARWRRLPRSCGWRGGGADYPIACRELHDHFVMARQAVPNRTRGVQAARPGRAGRAEE